MNKTSSYKPGIEKMPSNKSSSNEISILLLRVKSVGVLKDIFFELRVLDPARVVSIYNLEEGIHIFALY